MLVKCQPLPLRAVAQLIKVAVFRLSKRDLRLNGGLLGLSFFSDRLVHPVVSRHAAVA